MERESPRSYVAFSYTFRLPFTTLRKDCDAIEPLAYPFAEVARLSTALRHQPL